MDSHVLLCRKWLYFTLFSVRSDIRLVKIILGSIVTRCPSMSLAPSALVQLDSACELFSKAARGFRAGKVLVSRCASCLKYFETHLNLYTEHHAKPTKKGALQS